MAASRLGRGLLPLVGSYGAAASMPAFRALSATLKTAAAGDEGPLLPGLQAPAGAVSPPSPVAAEFGLPG
jgi:hypothetical protein